VTFLQAMLLAVLQGVSELFPVSSLGHTVLLPALFGWRIDRSDPTFLAFVVALHLGTALALLVFYRADWARIAGGLTRSVVRGRISEDPDERLGWLLVAGTIPLALVGVFLEEPVKRLFGSATLVAGFLILNAFVMFSGERLKRAESRRHARSARYPTRSGVGDRFLAGACLATRHLAFGLVDRGRVCSSGLDHEDARASRFCWPRRPSVRRRCSRSRASSRRRRTGVDRVAGGRRGRRRTAFASVVFLTRYFRSNDLRPFGWYCLIFGALCLTLALTKVIS
jgi:undecaprenyl-diphosphatase